ncbi:MAG: alpha/beta hydrolase, partial [Pseudomonadota bacterium]
MARQNVSFENADGTVLSGIVDRPDGPAQAWALFAHCFTCSKNTLAAARISEGLAARGIGVLRFDFTGLGQSDGDFSETGFASNVEDLYAAMAWMADQDMPIQLMIGHSLGGAATVVAAAERPEVRAVVTLGAPADADHVVHQFDQHVPEIEAKGAAQVDLAGRPFVLGKVFLESVREAKVRDAAAKLRRPLLVMHSPVDDVVSIDNATGLFLAAKHPKSFVSLDRAGHLLSKREDTDYVIDVIDGWSRRYLETPAASAAPSANGVVRVSETDGPSPYQNAVQIDGR